MGLRMFIGVIDKGDWKVAQYCNYLSADDPVGEYDGIRYRLGHAEAIRENLIRCKFITTLENQTSIMVNEYPSMVNSCGADVLDMISNCGPNETISLCDSRNFLDEEIECEYAFVINFDTWKLICYHNGRKFMIGEYDIDNLPDYRQFINDLENSEKMHKAEIKNMQYALVINALRASAISQGKDPDKAEMEFLRMMLMAPDGD